MSLGFSTRDSAKQRARRIPLDYLRRLDSMQRWKLSLTLIAALLSAAYLWWVLISSDGLTAFSPGPLVTAHAAWEADCAVCHRDFVAIRSDSANWLARAGVIGDGSHSTAESLRSQADRRCQACHAGPPHSPHELPASVPACAACHLDHLGRSATIARSSDPHCTRCHADIARQRRQSLTTEESSRESPLPNVRQFAIDPRAASSVTHPDFRSLATDPGNVKFNHHLHMAAGLPAADRAGQGQKLMTLADLPAAAIERYRRANQPAGSQPDSQFPIQLDCSSCHAFQDDRATSPGSAGAYALPVQYERDCQACHPLNFEPAAGREIPHGLTPNDVRGWLFGKLQTESGSAERAKPRYPWSPPFPIPGRVAPLSATETADHATDLDRRVADAEIYLAANNACRKCHFEVNDPPGESTTGLRRVQPANIPRVWLQHARFDHAAHRSFSCAECHASAFPPTVPQRSSEPDRILPPAGPADQEIVMIAGREVCLKCHSPRSANRSEAVARFDCVECHRYHAAGGIPTGSGGLNGHAADSGLLTIDEFLRGATAAGSARK